MQMPRWSEKNGLWGVGDDVVLVKEIWVHKKTNQELIVEMKRKKNS